jgi:hypothetical protein
MTTHEGSSRPRAWVVHESIFGNTRRVAEAVADGLRTSMDVDVQEVTGSPLVPESVDLLVVGGPTHAFGMSRPSTREDAAQRDGGSGVPAATGLREWLEALTFGGRAPAAAAFDTKVNHPKLPGSAAKKAAKRLRKLGCAEAVGPETFWVVGAEGPLADGELDRARRWGSELANTRRVTAGHGIL